MSIVIKNNASNFLADGINASQTTIDLQSAASFPTLGAGEYFYGTIESVSGQVEIVKVTNIAGNTLTVVRAQEGTSAASFVEGSRFELRVTVGSVEDYVKQNAELADYTPASASAITRVIQEKIQETVSVKDFGAAGDGVTDDTAAIQAAIDYATSVGGATVQLVDGEEYYTTSTINLKSNVILTGGALVTGSDLFHNGIAIPDDQENIVIDGVSIYPVAGQRGFNWAIRTKNVTNLIIRNCLIRDIGKLGTDGVGERGQGIRVEGKDFTGNADTLSNNVIIENNTILNIGGAGNGMGDWIYARSTSNIRVLNNYCDGSQRMGLAFTSFVDGFVIANNIFKNPGLACIDLETNDSGSYNLRNGVITGNRLENPGQQDPSSIGSQKFCMDFHPSCENIVFSNNVCTAGDSAIHFVYAINGARNITISNNIFDGVTSSAMILFGAGGSAENTSITNNKFLNVTASQPIVWFPGRDVGKYTNISDNYVNATTGSGTNGFWLNLDDSPAEQSIIISRNTVYGAFANTAYIQGFGGSTKVSVKVTQNYFRGFTTYAVRFRNAGGMLFEPVIISQNTFEGDSATGAIFGEELTGGQINERTFLDNYFSDVTTESNLNPTRAIGVADTRLLLNDWANVVPRTGAPTGPAKGDIYYELGDDKLKCYDGSVWQDLF